MGEEAKNDGQTWLLTVLDSITAGANAAFHESRTRGLRFLANGQFSGGRRDFAVKVLGLIEESDDMARSERAKQARLIKEALAIAGKDATSSEK
jgi:hypothetical protein